MLGFKVMKKFGYPLVFDVTHSLQIPGGLGKSAAGRRGSILEMGLAGLSQKIAGLFLEAHPDPDKALCDGPSALRLNQLEPFLEQMKAVDELVKSFETLDTDKKIQNKRKKYQRNLKEATTVVPLDSHI